MHVTTDLSIMDDTRITKRKDRLKMLWISLKKTHEVYGKQYYLMTRQANDIMVRFDRATKNENHAFVSSYKIRLQIYTAIIHQLDNKLMNLEQQLRDMIPVLRRFGIYR